MRDISIFTAVAFLLAGLLLAEKAAAFTGEELGYECLDSSHNVQRIAYRDACQTLAIDSGYRVGVFRPCNRNDIDCAHETVCVDPEVNYVCIGYALNIGDCTENSDCSTGFYCKKSPGYCGGYGVCEQKPTVGECPAIFDPVCGCDGSPYNNSCEAALAGVNFRPGSCM